MSVVSKSATDIIVSETIRRRASAPPKGTYTPTKSEKARIRSGRAAIRANDYVTFDELPGALEAEVRASRAKVIDTLDEAIAVDILD